MRERDAEESVLEMMLEKAWKAISGFFRKTICQEVHAKGNVGTQEAETHRKYGFLLSLYKHSPTDTSH